MCCSLTGRYINVKSDLPPFANRRVCQCVIIQSGLVAAPCLTMAFVDLVLKPDPLPSHPLRCERPDGPHSLTPHVPQFECNLL